MSLRTELTRIESEKERLTANLDSAAEKIRRTLGELGHRANGQPGKAPARKQRKSRRIRRNADQLKREGEAIFQFIKSAGNEGASGREIRKAHPNVGQNIKAFVQKYTSHKVKTTGKKVSMRYHAA